MAACGGDQSCDADGNPTFTHAVTDLSQLTHILPLGEVQTQHDFTGHTYLTNSSTAAVPVYAPADLEVYNVVNQGADYALQARVNCNVFVELRILQRLLPS